MSCATAKKDGSSRYANSIHARSTRLAGSVRERAIAPNSAKSFSPIANSIACRHAVMSSTLSANQSRKPRTHVGKCESSTYDGFHGIDVLVPESCSQPMLVLALGLVQWRGLMVWSRSWFRTTGKGRERARVQGILEFTTLDDEIPEARRSC